VIKNNLSIIRNQIESIIQYFESKPELKLGLKIIAKSNDCQEVFLCLTHIRSGANLIKLFFLRFFFFGDKLGHFTINLFLLYVTNMQVYQQKTEKFFVSKENKFYRIGSGLQQ